MKRGWRGVGLPVAVALGLIGEGLPAAAEGPGRAPATQRTPSEAAPVGKGNATPKLGGAASRKPGGATTQRSRTATGAREHAHLELAPTGAAFRQLIADNQLGDLRIVGYDGTALVIDTDKHAPDAESLDRLRVTLIPNPDGTVRLVTVADTSRESRPVGKSELRLDLTIKVPRTVRLDARVGSGTLTAENLDAGGELDAVSGTIKVKNVSGGLIASTISGAQTFTTVFGALDSSAVNADVAIDSVVGPSLVASVHRGAISARRVRSKRIGLTSTQGAIALEAESSAGSVIDVRSVRGDVNVTIRRRGALRIVAMGETMKLPTGTANETDGNGVRHLLLGTAPTSETAVLTLQSRYGAVKLVAIQ
ncbi:MAG: DUF4097 family beta strand repeat protein [Kofleriaceae bacterium]|nr:DUF4097 family beta strand repeat protein [Kofleriaceae bacterium]